MQLVSAADIDNYIENKHLAAEDDWAALLFDAAGNCIGTRLIPSLENVLSICGNFKGGGSSGRSYCGTS